MDPIGKAFFCFYLMTKLEVNIKKAWLRVPIEFLASIYIYTYYINVYDIYTIYIITYFTRYYIYIIFYIKLYIIFIFFVLFYIHYI